MTDRSDVEIRSLANNWWALAIRGVLAILFGILTAFVPGLTLSALIFMFGVYAIVEGGFNVIAGIQGRRAERAWWALILEGVVSIAAGVIAFIMPGLTALALLYLIAAWAIVTGVLEIAAAIRLRRQIEGEWCLVVTGVLSLIFGALVLYSPGAGALALVLWIGAYAMVFGVLVVAVAFRLRSARDELPEALPHGASAR